MTPRALTLRLLRRAGFVVDTVKRYNGKRGEPR
jgi:hypothetical protein